MSTLAPLVGWVERSETHDPARVVMGFAQFCRALPILQTVIILMLAAIAGPAAAQSLFGKQVEVTLAGQDGKPMAAAEVKVFAPGNFSHPVVTGKTDGDGKFYFTADRDGFWTAEAKNGKEVARVSIKITGTEGGSGPVSPWLLYGLLLALLAAAIGFRVLRARARRRPPAA